MKKNILLFFSCMALILFSGNILAQQKGNSRNTTPKSTPPSQIKKMEKVSLHQVANKLRAFNIKQMPIPTRNTASIYRSIAPIFPHHRPDYVTQIYTDSQTGLPIFIQGEAGILEPSSLQNEEDIKAATFKYLRELSRLLQIQDPENEFEIKQIIKDDFNTTHVKLQQVYMGVPVYASELNFHIESKGSIYLNMRYMRTTSLQDIIPTLTKASAIDAGLQSLGNQTVVRELTQEEKKMLQYDAPQAELILYKTAPLSTTLAYHITYRPNFMERWEYFVDAHTGEILHTYNHTCTFSPVTGNGTHLNGNGHTVHSFRLSNNQFILVDASKDMYVHRNNGNPPDPELGHGVIVTLDMQNTNPQNDNAKFEEIISGNNSWSQLDLSAHVNSGIAYDYFRNTFNWQSINGEGGDIISFINVADENGRGFDNAFWNGAAMFYGNGDVAFSALAGSVDVGGHEMGHGVIQATANLEYMNESGALNESYADIFGAMIDRDDWQLGEDVVNSNIFRSGALRDMQDPHNGGNSLNDNGYQPSHVNEQFTGSQDNGGVHINSGINNRAYYLVANAIGKDKAEQIFFDALRFELTRSSNFIDMRLAAEKRANSRYGANEASAVRSAYDQVGIIPETGGGGGSEIPGDLQVNQGQDYIISEDINPQDPNTLYISNTAVTGFQALSQQPSKRPISITDNGILGYFVGLNDNEIYETITDPNRTLAEQILFSDLAVWDNVAVSKSGNRIATVSIAEDSAIYVWDLSNRPNLNGVKYSLFNPTTSSDGSVTRNVRFADAVQWDNTGEYVLYDAFNSITNNQGENVDYWDVGLLKAWDNQTNDFGDGTISKIFTQLPEGVSVGNASFSKNSPSIFAFDFLDEMDPFTANDDIYIVYGANFETGDIGIIANNNAYGFPSYSKLDDIVIFGALDGGGNEIVKRVNLQADKITGSTNPSDLIEAARFPVWYTIGFRDFNPTNIEEDLAESYGLKVYPNPFTHTLKMDIDLDKTGELEVSLYDILGHKVQQLRDKTSLGSGHHEITYSIAHLPAGTYTMRMVINGRATHLKLVKAGF